MIATDNNGTMDMARTSNGQQPESSIRILVVDDEEAITDLVATTLRYEGFSVETAASGREALGAVKTFRPAARPPRSGRARTAASCRS